MTSRWLIIGCVVAVLAGAAGVVVWAWNRPKDPDVAARWREKPAFVEQAAHTPAQPKR
jgi:hypothetical protein